MMKKLLLLFIMGLFASFAYPQGYTIDFGKNQNGVQVHQNDYQKVVMSVNFSGIDAVSVNSQKGNFKQLNLQGTYRTGIPGEAQLPTLKKLIEIPVGATVSVKALSYDVTDYALSDYGIREKILPYQPSYPKSIDPSKVEFIYNEASYKKDAFNELDLVSVESVGTIRGIELAKVTINPVRYNPAKNVIRVYNNVQVEVTFNGGSKTSTEKLRAKTASPYFDAIYSTIINHTKDGKDNYSDNPDHTKYPVKYLIVTAPEFETQLAPFVEWKIKKGFYVTLATTTETGTTAAQIKTWVSNQYAAATETDPAPTFLLLVGDVAQVPASKTGDESAKATDLYYCTMDGTSDIIPDMYYGRFSAQTTTQLQNMLDKVLYYEKYEFADPSYLNKTTLIAGADGTWNPRVGQPTINYATTNYFNAAHGFTTVNTYLNSYTNCYAANQINVSFINYTAHGSETSWADPNLTQSMVNAFTNANQYPLAIGNCCLAADFGTSECLGETWMRKANGGAVAYIGSSPSSYWWEDFYWSVGAHDPVYNQYPTFEGSTLGAYDAPFVSDYLCVDAMLFVGNLAVTEAHDQGYDSSIGTKYYWEAYNCLSDPSIFIYLTEGEDNTVSHLPTVPIGVSSYDVTALAGSYVAISKDGVLHGTALVPESGTVTVALDPITTGGNVDIVVTKDQYKPYITSVPAAALDGPYLTVDNITIDDAAGNNNDEGDFGESFNIDLTVKNVGSAIAQGVVASITTSDSYVTSFTNNENVALANVPVNGTITSSNKFSMVISDQVPDQHVVVLNNTLSDNSTKEIYQSTKSIKINAPKLVVTNVLIDDSGSGDNNNILDPGETALLTFTIENQGHAQIITEAELSFESGSSSYMSINSSADSIGYLAEGESGTVSFEISANSGVALGTPVDLVINVVTGNTAYNIEDNYQVVIGLIPEFNMTNGTYTTSVGLFYDSGGPDAPYANGEDYTITFKPSVSGRLIKVTFTDFNTEASSSGCYDPLYVYDGEATSAALLGTYCGTANPGEFIATSSSGALTFRFTSDGSSTPAGWVAEISTIDAVNVKFVVTDGVNPIEGAAVTFNGETINTDEDGEAVFVYFDSKATLDYSISAYGFYDYSNSLTVTDADIIENVTMTAKPRFDITFSVTSASIVIEGAVINFNSEEKTTDATGNAIFTNIVEANGYEYSVSKDNYVTVNNTVDVDASKTVNVVLTDNILTPVIIGVSNLREGNAKLTYQANKLFTGYSIYIDNMATPVATGIQNLDYTFTGLVNGQTYNAGIQGLYSTGVSDLITKEFTYNQLFTVKFHVAIDGVNEVGVPVEFNGQTVTTDASGIASFDIESADAVSYNIDYTGYYAQSGTIDATADLTKEIDLVFIPDVTFIVKDQDGVAVENAKVYFNSTSLYTDTDGHVTFENINAADNKPYRVSLGGYLATIDTIDVVDVDLIENVTIQKLADITFVIKDEDNLALTGARVTFNGNTMIVDANGVAVFTDVLPSESMDYLIKLTSYLASEGSIEVTLVDQVVNITLYPIPDVKFIVTDGTNAIHGATVIFNNITSSTDNNGESNYIDIQPGSYPYSIIKGGYYDVIDTLVVEYSNVTENVIMSIIPDVTFTIQSDNQPIESAKVTFNGAAVTSNTNGQVTFTDVFKGEYSYKVELSGYYTIEETLTVGDVNIEKVVDLAIIPDLTFVVTDGTAVMEGVKVVLDGKIKYTNTQGKAVFANVVAGKYGYSLTKDLYADIKDSIDVEAVDIEETKVMELKAYVVTFNITDGENAISSAGVAFNNQNVLSNSEGKAIFENVAPGIDLAYTVSKNGYLPIEGKVDVEINDVSKSIVLELITYSVTFVVSDENGFIEGATVTFSDKAVLTSPEGEALFTNVVPGVDLPFIVKETSAHNNYSGTVTVDSDETVPVTLIIGGISESNQIKLSIFPNPTSGLLTISANKDLDGSNIEVSDETGRIVLSKASNTANELIDLSSLSKGIYFVKVILGDNSKIEKVIVR